MKKAIDSLKVQALKEKLFIAFMMFFCEAISMFPIIEQLFPNYVAKVRAAYDNLNCVYLKYDEDLCTKAVDKADKNRNTAFTKLRNAIRSFLLYQIDAAKTLAAEVLLNVIDQYGGASVVSLGLNSKTAVIVNLVEDLEKKQSAEVEVLGIGSLVEELKQAQATYTRKYMDRAECDSKTVKGAMNEARKEMTKAYRNLVAIVSLEAKNDNGGELAPFVNLMNTEIGRYRVYTGQGQVGNSTNTDSESEEEETVELSTQTFHFADHHEEQITEPVGSPLTAPANTQGYVWEPTVPATMPADDQTYNEMKKEPDEEDWDNDDFGFDEDLK